VKNRNEKQEREQGKKNRKKKQNHGPAQYTCLGVRRGFHAARLLGVGCGDPGSSYSPLSAEKTLSVRQRSIRVGPALVSYFFSLFFIFYYFFLKEIQKQH
jgi:hypothetical protein